MSRWGQSWDLQKVHYWARGSDHQWGPDWDRSRVMSLENRLGKHSGNLLERPLDRNWALH